MRKAQQTARPASVAVTFACLLGTAACLALFQADLNRSLRRLNESPVGSVVFSSRAALRRFQDRIIWDRLRKESPVYNGDFIRTAERSEAAIHFSGGELVSLSENTLIRIFVEGGTPRINFSQGNINVDTGENGGLVVSSGEKRVNVPSGAAFSLDTEMTEGEESFRVQVMEGNVSIITPEETVEAAAGTAFTLGPEGIPVGESGFAAKPSVSLASARFLAPVNTPIPVEFTLAAGVFSEGGTPAPSAPGGKVRIEIAGDRNFTRSLRVLEETPGTDSASVTAELPAGSWWWRVYPAGEEGGRAKEKGQFTVTWTPPPQPVSPAPASAYYYQTNLPELRFQWTSSEEVQHYILEAADNPDMANPVLQEEVRSGSLVYSRLGEGQWYWRVTPVFPGFYQGNVPPSPVVPFSISRGEPPPIQTETPVTAPPTVVPPPVTPAPRAAVAAPARAAPVTRPRTPPPAVVRTPPARTAVPAPPPEPPPAPPAEVVEAPVVMEAPPTVAPFPQPALPEPVIEPEASLSERVPDSPPERTRRRFPAAAGRIPPDGYVISFGTLKASRTIAFNWSPVTGADSYIFTLFYESPFGGRESLIVAEDSRASYILEDLSLLDQGNFIWQVEAVSRGPDGTLERRGTAGENRFTVDIPKPEAPRGRDAGALYGR
jgi:hypothetical protein